MLEQESTATLDSASEPIEATFGDWVADFGSDSDAPAQPSSTTAPEAEDDIASLISDVESRGPKSKDERAATNETADADERAEANDGDGTAKQSEAKSEREDAALERQQSKPEDDADDPELTAEENAEIRKHPKSQWSERRRLHKAAQLEGKFKNPDYPVDHWIKHLESKSPDRFAEAKKAIVAQEIADPLRFTVRLHETSPEAYGKLAATVFENDQEFFIREIAGREGVTLDVVRQALAAHLDGGAQQQAQPEAATEAAAKLYEELTTFYDVEEEFPELAERLKSAIEASPRKPEPAPSLPMAETPPAAAATETLEQAQARFASEQAAQAAEVARLAQESEAIWEDAYAVFTKSADAQVEEKFGQKVSDAERKNAPEVADLKETFNSAFRHGLPGKVPDLEQGFLEYGKQFDGFEQKVKSLGEFTQAREKQKALKVVAELTPVLEKYLAERTKLPYFQNLSKQINRAARSVSERPVLDEAFTPGRPQASAGPSSKSADPMQALNDFLVADALSG